ncbi:MAG: PQQ-binding-like beta-propeller repeat protein [Planctomycetota bacterium]
MKKIGLQLTVAIVTIFTLQMKLPADDWLRFRGNDGSGVAKDSQPTVTEFSQSKNLVWKSELPGAGASSPILVGQKIFITCYSGYGLNREVPGDIADLKRHVCCFDKSSGKKIWQKDLDSVQPEDPFYGMGVPEHGYASATPVSDGKYLFTFFGKTGVQAFDLDGNSIWSTSVGTSSGSRKWGSGASLEIHDNIVIVNASDESATLYGLDKQTGKTIWKNDNIENVWSTPLVVGTGDEATLVFSVPYEVWGLNPSNGKLKWFSTNGVQDSTVSTSPIAENETIVAMGGRSSTAVAIRTGGEKGQDVTDSHTIWEARSTSKITTPVMVDGYIYGISRGIATCLDAKTGEEVFRERVPTTSANGTGRRSPSSDYCSPVVADGKIYQFTKNGSCYVMAAKPKFEMLMVNSINDGSEFNSTPAVLDGKLFVRSNKFLYCIGK